MGVPGQGTQAAGVRRSRSPSAAHAGPLATGRARGPTLRRGRTRRDVSIVSTRTYGRCGTTLDSLTSRKPRRLVSFSCRYRPGLTYARKNWRPSNADGRSPTLPYGHICAPCDARWHPAPAVSIAKGCHSRECSWVRNVTHTRPQGVVITAPVTAPAPELGTVRGNVTGNVGGNVTPRKITDHPLTACSSMLH